MKRIKIAENQFFALYRLESETGATISFELTRPPYSGPKIAILKTFPAKDWKLAAQCFLIASDLIQTTGRRKRRLRIREWLERSGLYVPKIRRRPTRETKRKTPINPILH